MKPIGSIEEFNSRIKRILITKEEIDEAIKKAGKEIDKLYADGRTTLMGDDELIQIINFYRPRLMSEEN